MPGLLRVATAGNVDDGKSTLIGRLLHDAKAVLADQLAAVEGDSARRGFDRPELALLVDGLRDEREQGITIDVAHRYFATPRRSFVLADTPGHVQYTRNTVTGASTADVAVVLLDARTGLTDQGRRHTAIAALLGLRHVVLAVNKMDAVGFSAEVFERHAAEFGAVARRLGVRSWTAVPLSALHGDNVVEPSERTPWYGGTPLLRHLEELELEPERHPGGRLPVQLVIRPRTEAHADFRGYAGRVAAGGLAVGDEVVAQPDGWRTVITGIDTADGPLERAGVGRSVVVRLADELDAGRGALLCSGRQPEVARALEAVVCWLAHEPLRPGGRYLLRHTTRERRAVVESVGSRLDVATLERGPAEELALNDIGVVRLRLDGPVAVDRYAESRSTGAFALVDEVSGGTAAAGMVLGTR
ncbi:MULTISPECIES: sulfate adenylyltransferase subunit 1 [Actinosynnema]|uniref:sulfate adenylyltransferase subunit 1 n=1 Tax=Actinosynnema TaxID=40566 RepID=UPI0020A3174E|nr:GTP-binding protein [Actinosynnema pretiosum]MCP2098739.1 sulfate adenylyltransferase subunit 1 [Actinosynnema pretiosum]